jgi:membrane protein implicated in regulation of membrane protease activity
MDWPTTIRVLVLSAVLIAQIWYVRARRREMKDDRIKRQRRQDALAELERKTRKLEQFLGKK